ncbi:hypothetical protein Tco_0530286 [Tanacetum coccineum]
MVVFTHHVLTDKKELIHHEGTALVPLRLELIELWFQFPVPKSVAGSRFPKGVLMINKDDASSRDIQLICTEFSSIQVKSQAELDLHCKVHITILTVQGLKNLSRN